MQRRCRGVARRTWRRQHGGAAAASSLGLYVDNTVWRSGRGGGGVGNW